MVVLPRCEGGEVKITLVKNTSRVCPFFASTTDPTSQDVLPGHVVVARGT